MPNTVNTVGGVVDPLLLGVTLMHEHVFVRPLETTANYSSTWGTDEERVAEAVRTLSELHRAGVGTIVDLTVLGLGRDIRLVQRVAEQVPIRIVAATGAYVLDRLPYQWGFNPPTSGGSAAAGIAEWFTRDIVEGIAGTSVRAGVIKCATDVAGITDDVRTVLEAASIASVETGASIITHADARTQRGLDQQRVFAEQGVDLARVVIGHAGDSTDLDYLRRLMDAGSTIGMDRFGLESPVSTAERVRVVATLCAQG
ncbi:phosphotriesterase [soil metagenome]